MAILNTKLRYLLAPLGYLYDAGAAIRNLLYDAGWKSAERVSRPVISVGNLSFGGTGKTPLVAKLAQHLRDSGFRVCILSRGYGRKSRGRVLVADFSQVYADAEAAGDEPALLARTCPGVMVIVDADRVSAAKAFESDCDCFVLDDGFQHRQLYRDLDIVLLDARQQLPGLAPSSLSGYREGAGSLKRASFVVLTHANHLQPDMPDSEFREHLRLNTPVFVSNHRIGRFRDALSGQEVGTEALRGRQVISFAGIGNPFAFEQALEAMGAGLVRKIRFPDHHWYTLQELRAIVDANPGITMVTTEKDEIRLAGFVKDVPGITLLAAILEIDLPGWQEFAGLADDVIRKKQSEYSS